ncbi:NRDE family protein [Virgibacillus kekensis]|uniref:NRDE family protein n=1 Tax=Virgibacillus kekensis TaxID=202261 RepID=A0ABV9DLV4_9BACI
MCLINFQINDHPNYKLIVAANRDEFYQRPTAPAHYWKDNPYILAGRDLVQNGTWLGITKDGQFAALTNYRNPGEDTADKLSRGSIVRDFLSEDGPPLQFLESLQEKKNNYAGFNVIVGSADALYHYSNANDTITNVPAGTHGLSNHLLNTPWPKVVKGKQQLQTYLEKNKQLNPDELFRIISDAEEAEDNMLPDTGVGKELERKLSPLFINMADYGTRSSTVLTIDKNNQVHFVERSYENSQLTQEKQFEFCIKDR